MNMMETFRDMRNMKKQSAEGVERITDERYDISASELNQLFEIAKNEGLYHAVTTAFYAGLNTGYKIAGAEAIQSDTSVINGRKVIGCPYCGVDDVGDIPGSLKDLILLHKAYSTEDKAVDICDDEVPGDMTTNIAVYRDKLTFFDNGNLRAERTINYCPVCGRKLRNN